jgi:hypothetical protein
MTHCRTAGKGDLMPPGVGGGGEENRARSRCDRAPIDRLAARTYWQLEAIILTESTFSFGAFVVELAVALVPVLVALVAEAPPSTVPVISTLCPTCGVSWLSSASRR